MKDFINKGVSVILALVLSVTPLEWSLTPAYAFSGQNFGQNEENPKSEKLIENSEESANLLTANFVRKKTSLVDKEIIRLEFFQDGQAISCKYEILKSTKTEEIAKEDEVVEEIQREETIEEDYNNTQKEVTSKSEEPVATQDDAAADTGATQTEALYSGATFKVSGVIKWGGYRWTWYSQKILPGGGLRIPGRTTDEQNYVVDENDYICLASSDLAKGTVIDTPFGKQGKVYDCGCAHGTVDVYTNW